MKFICIISSDTSGNKQRYHLIEKACQQRSITFVPVFADQFDFSEPQNQTEPFILYRVSNGKVSKTVEKQFLGSHSATIYQTAKYGLATRGYSFFYDRFVTANYVPTIAGMPKTKTQAIKYAEKLGGYPLIVKVMGSSHGVGVIKVESLESLVSLSDYLATQYSYAIMRKYIPHTRQGRLIVLGSQVIASHENLASHDFRTNFGDQLLRKRQVKTYSKEISAMAVEAVNAMGIEFAGVDVLFDKETDQPYISEVNSPFYFPTTQELTGVDVAGKLVEYLLQKTTKL